MQSNRPLEVVFLTNFSNSSYRAVPAIAQLADELDTRVTILHAFPPEAHRQFDQESRLANFFPEADIYRATRRVAFPGSVVEAIQNLRNYQYVDLVVAPSSDPLGVPKMMRSSLRSRIIRECGVPVWTMGKAIHSVILNRPAKKVGCWVNLDAIDTTHLSLAFEYASNLEAQVHLMCALPTIDEGSLASSLTSSRPLFKEGVLEEIRSMVGWTPGEPQIHLESGSPSDVMPKLVRELNLNIVFAGREESLRQGLTSMGISKAVDRCVCPVICCDGPNVEKWRLRRGSAFPPARIAA